jgi:endo-1,4-beta-D-glucanase Y
MIPEPRMRVSSAAALTSLACAVALVMPACSAPDRGSGGQAGAAGSGTAGQGGAAGQGGSAGSNAGSGATAGASATGGVPGTAGASAGRGGSAAGTGGQVGSAGSAGSAGASAGAGGRGGTAGGGGGAGTAPAVVIPGAGNCTPPLGADPADAQAAYAKFKTDIVTSDGAGGFLRVRRPNSSGAVINSTVSEGIAYGMLLAVYAGDQPSFDKFWQYSQIHLDSNGLMHWYIGPGGETLGTGAASDSDEDIAFALIAADARWGGRGSLTTNYIDLAKTQIDKIWQYEVDHTRNDVLKPGDTGFDGSVINISYFAPAYYRVFGRVTGQTANWNRVAATSYQVMEAALNAQNGNATNGLVPAWSTPAGVPMRPAGTGHPIHHQLDSCRTPFRVALDYCWNAEPRALAYLQKINAFHAGVGAAAMVDGYELNGTPRPEFVTAGGPRAASFVGTAGVGAMATGAAHATFRADAYASVKTLTQLAGSIYYQTSWTALTLQMMTGLMPVPP